MANSDFTNFERQGNIEFDIQLSSIKEIKEAVISHTENTLRTLKIFTPNLEAEIYNNDEFRKTLLDFTRGNRHAQIQILVNDLTDALHSGHKLIGLAQQLSSVVTIKDTPEELLGANNSFILFDQANFIYKPNTASHEAISSACKNRSNKLNDFFTLIWEHAEQNTHTRRLSI